VRVHRATRQSDHIDPLKAVFKDYNPVGITSVADRNANPDSIARYLTLRDDNQLTVRIGCRTAFRLRKRSSTQRHTSAKSRSTRCEYPAGVIWFELSHLEHGNFTGPQAATAGQAEEYQIEQRTLRPRCLTMHLAVSTTMDFGILVVVTGIEILGDSSGKAPLKKISAAKSGAAPICIRLHRGAWRIGYANAQIEVSCPYCRRRHRHGWLMTGEIRTELRKSNCADGGEYLIRPALAGESGAEQHHFDPHRPIVRLLNKRAG
jgi:hypothetical protein